MKKFIASLDYAAIKAFILLTVSSYFAYFWRCSSFGFYEDDYAYFSPIYNWNWNSLINDTISNFLIWPQGRPLGFTLSHTLFYVGLKMGGLGYAYMLGFFIFILNAFLFYLILRKLGNETFAVVGCMAYCLFPADTTRPFLMHELGLQPSLTFLLFATYFYLTGKRRLSYIIIIGSLLTYETPFFVFLGIPLLKLKWDKKFLKEIISHIVILIIILLYVLVMRLSIGEKRVTTELINYQIPLKAVVSLILGPLVSMGTILYVVERIIFFGNSSIFLIIIVGIVLFFFVLMYIFDCFRKKSDFASSLQGEIMDGFFARKIRIPIPNLPLAKMFLISMVLTSLSYLSSFTHFPPIATAGRATSVHLSAVLGVSILVACIWMAILDYSDHHNFKILAIFFLGTSFSLLVGYGNLIQNDFVNSWVDQRIFWQDVIDLAPDMTNGTMIFYVNDESPILPNFIKTNTIADAVLTKLFRYRSFIETHSWADPIILENLYKFPDNWKNPPRLFTVSNDWIGDIKQTGDGLIWLVPSATWPEHNEVLPISNVIVLHEEDGKLVRKEGSLNVNNELLLLKTAIPNSPKLPYQKTRVYTLLFNNR